MGFALTREQQAAVDQRGSGILVSAAAGSGKTRVLVERLLCRVAEEGADIDRFLIITYTKAAAAELRGRIQAELSDRLAQRPGDAHLRRQTTLVYKAQISTIHAFCAQLLRECGYLLDLNPDFRLCDEGEAGTLMLRALNDVMDRRYEGLDPEGDFAQLVDTLSAGRDDSRLMRIVLDIRGRVQAHPDPAAWLDEQAERFRLDGVTDAGETVWGELLLKDAARQADYWRGRLLEALELCQSDPVLEGNYASTLGATLDDLDRFRTAARQGWDAAADALPISFPRAGSKKGVEDEEAAQRVKALRAACKKRMDKLGEWFSDRSDPLLGDLRAAYPAMRALVALVKDFETAYGEEKARRGLLDFADLEHLTVRLLVEDGAPTALARQWALRYDEVMVDEYQDTNEVQNAILNALTGGGRNLFMVGDVKQSIYRFRLADPTIFLKKYRAFRPWEEAEEGEDRRILLSQNFRSRAQVLEGANFLFHSLMSEEFGEMDYTEDEELRPGATFPEDQGRCAVELDVLDCSANGGDADETGKVSRDLLEARFVARRMRDLLEERFPVSDGEGGLRPARPGDMVVLLRSPGTVLHHYARALSERDLPWEAEGGADFFAAAEVNVALSLLQVVDNPRQDVSLISVLRSPVYGFSADRLAQIRAGSPQTDFYDALCADGGEDSQAFLAELKDLRFEAGEKSSHELIWDLYDRTNLLGVFGAMEEGERRQSNLLTLAELARRFEGTGHKGLFGFLTHLNRLRENGSALLLPGPAREGGGVRILSIHRSKGLEFPIVFLCGLTRRLNREDMNEPILFHPRLGVGPKGLDEARRVEYPTLARLAVARQLEREMMAEELRLLYVAVTRAQEKLFLSCALTRGAEDLGKLAQDADCPVDPQVLLGCQSVGQWVLLAALSRPDAAPLQAAAGVPLPIPGVEFGPAWDVKFVDGAPLLAQPRPWAEEREEAAREDVTGVEALSRRLGWVYPHAAQVELPSKLTATQLKGRPLDSEVEEEAPRPPRPLTFRRPRFAAEEFGLTPAERGTALHLVMQYMDFDHAGTVEEAAAEIARLQEKEFLTPQQAEAVAPEKLVRFFTSPLGQELRAAPTLRREFKFSLLAAADAYYPQAEPGEQVLLQGVVDCCFETLEGITVVDFKTDRVTERTLTERAAYYRPQLEVYSQALAEMTGKPVIRRVLWFFALDRAVEV